MPAGEETARGNAEAEGLAAAAADDEDEEGFADVAVFNAVVATSPPFVVDTLPQTLAIAVIHSFMLASDFALKSIDDDDDDDDEDDDEVEGLTKNACVRLFGGAPTKSRKKIILFDK